MNSILIRLTPMLLILVSALHLNGQTTLDCTVQDDKIARGCFSGRDCIPALTNPKLLQADEAAYLNDSDLVLGVYKNGIARAYPHPILWWHEIVNDTLAGEKFLISLCPLTSTGLLFDATLDGQEHDFGVSGLLYNNNLIMYDRVSGETLFPQICFIGKRGPLAGEQLKLLPIVESTWAAWKALHPNTTVLSDDTGVSRNYSRYPYGDYRVNNDFLLFPLTRDDRRLPRKDIVLGVILNDIERAYPFKAMGEYAVFNDEIGGTKIGIVYSKEAQIAVPFFRTINGQDTQFTFHEAIEKNSLVLFRDTQTGSIWDMSGKAVSGAMAGTGVRLEQVPAYNSMWFAWGAFWDKPEIADVASLLTSVQDESPANIPEAFVLQQNYPNPFNPTTEIQYSLSQPGNVTLKIYDVRGNEVATLINNEAQQPGTNTITWHGTDNFGTGVSSGVYFYRLSSGRLSISRKMLLVR